MIDFIGYILIGLSTGLVVLALLIIGVLLGGAVREAQNEVKDNPYRNEALDTVKICTALLAFIVVLYLTILFLAFAG